MEEPPSAVTVLLSEFCCEKTAVIFVLPNWSFVFNPNKL